METTVKFFDDIPYELVAIKSTRGEVLEFKDNYDAHGYKLRIEYTTFCDNDGRTVKKYLIYLESPLGYY